ncbi:zinc protease [Nitrosospira multiformis]|uniref:Zinc protease n=1 Tax=Nitrosospira multiformis TaxID=1231 RepID=A0A1I0FCK9_9PROT|nr:pitrilysin family protein [Nitrosospira multiformis]SET55668.1 zinc protease [Nitrosospira multiformis]
MTYPCFRFLPTCLWAALVIPISLFSSTALASTHEFTLGNGLRLIVKEDHRSPVVISQIWYKAGSIDEVNGRTGVAHVLEHMMFKGTKKVPGGEFSRLIAAAGGRENAFTGQDYTAYFQQLHKSRLPLAMELESDRMRNLVLTEEEFSKEIKVVMEERRLRTDDQARALVHETLMATSYQSHPYRHPVIGWMNDLQNMTVEDARQWYERWYAPNNAVLVVVGDVDPRQTFNLARKYYGQIKAKPVLSLDQRKPQIEPKQLGVKRLTVKAPAQLPYVAMAYHALSLSKPETDWEPYALEMLAGVLDGNESARLNKVLVREQRIASTAGASYDSTTRGPAVFYLDGTPSEGKTVVDVEAALRAEIEKLVRDGVTEEELARVKAQVVAGHVFQLDSMFFQAMQIGQLESIGLSYRDVDTILRKLQAVTAEQVREVAKKYLKDDNLTIAVLDPQPLEQKAPAAVPAGLRH